MKIVKSLSLAAVLALTTSSYAGAAGLGGFGGTPDAQNGARGRDQPSSFYGQDRMYSGRSAGYGRGPYGYGPAYGYGPRHGYGDDYRRRGVYPY